MSETLKFGLGALPNPPDERDYILANYLIPQAIPSTVSYRDQMTPVKYQGQLGSCVAFAVSAVKEFFDKIEFNTKVDLSEQWLYGACKKIDGYDGEGTYPRTAMDILLKQGTPEEKYQPYEGAYPPHSGPLPGYLENAEIYKILAYATVTGGLQGIKEAIALNGPVGISIEVYDNFYGVDSSGMVPAPSGERVGGHMMCAVGYDDTQQILIIKNSWSTAWGNGGYCFMPYSVWEQVGMGAMSMIDKNNLKHWNDWPDDSLKEQDLVYRNGWLKGYPDGSFRPWNTLTKRQVALVAGRLGLVDITGVVYKTFLEEYSPATRGFVRDFIPELVWLEERWYETLTRYQFVLLLARSST
jgi:hypothetical protein